MKVPCHAQGSHPCTHPNPNPCARRTFEVEYEFFGSTQKAELMPGGSSKPVTAANRRQYVDLYTQWWVAAGTGTAVTRLAVVAWEAAAAGLSHEVMMGVSHEEACASKPGITCLPEASSPCPAHLQGADQECGEAVHRLCTRLPPGGLRAASLATYPSWGVCCAVCSGLGNMLPHLLRAAATCIWPVGWGSPSTTCSQRTWGRHGGVTSNK